MPTDPDAAEIRAHAHSTGHRDEILRSRSCGCFHCLAIFPPQIDTWVDDEVEFLERMRAHWF